MAARVSWNRTWAGNTSSGVEVCVLVKLEREAADDLLASPALAGVLVPWVDQTEV